MGTSSSCVKNTEMLWVSAAARAQTSTLVWYRVQVKFVRPLLTKIWKLMHRKYWFYSITFAVIMTELFVLGLSKASSWQDSEWQAELDDTYPNRHD